jgi:polyisoprenoid-binding protein YceI
MLVRWATERPLRSAAAELLVFVLALVPLPRVAGAATWAIDPQATRVEFRIAHLLVSSVSGQMRGVTGSAAFDDADLRSADVEVRIDAATIDTGNAERDQHLRSADFLDVGTHPDIRFSSTRVEALEANRFRVSGDLTLHGVTKPVQLEVTRDSSGADAITFTGHTELSRSAFGIEYSRLLIGDDIDVAIAVRLVRAPPAD